MSAPLADRLRPQTLDDVVGQRHLLAEGKALRRIIDSGQIPNMVFYGPSGVGKTTLATMIAKTTNRKLVKMNGTTASTSDIKDVISNLNTFETMNGVLLYLDEIQYFNKKQQQILLEFIENGQITLIASTTENPYFYVYNAVLSRCTVFEFKSCGAKRFFNCRAGAETNHSAGRWCCGVHRNCLRRRCTQSNECSGIVQLISRQNRRWKICHIGISQRIDATQCNAL